MAKKVYYRKRKKKFKGRKEKGLSKKRPSPINPKKSITL